MIDIVEQDGVCYVPLQTMNDLFLNSMYVNLIFNGDALYLIPYQSSLLSAVYQAQPADMSQEFALFNYNELRFLLDCFYGLKDEHGIKDFGIMLAENTGLVDGLISTDSLQFDEALAQLINLYLDDGHSAMNQTSWRTAQEPNIYKYIGYTSGNSADMISLYSRARLNAFPEGMYMYQEVGDTAFVAFDAFTTNMDYSGYYHMDELTEEDFFLSPENLNPMQGESGEEDEEASEEGQEDSSEPQTEPQSEKTPVDTIQLLTYAYRQITREGSPIKNVVLDLSNNMGGASDAAIFTLVWLIGEADIAVRDTFTGAETIMRLTADLELDNNYDPGSKGLVNHGYNVYCLISPNSFSCGNLVPAACKMSGRVTLMGRTSGGGSCVVLPCTSASGTVFQISGSMQLSTVCNGSFYNIDQGIEPDVILTHMESFYDREGLVDLIHNLK